MLHQDRVKYGTIDAKSDAGNSKFAHQQILFQKNAFLKLFTTQSLNVVSSAPRQHTCNIATITSVCPNKNTGTAHAASI